MSPKLPKLKRPKRPRKRGKQGNLPDNWPPERRIWKVGSTRTPRLSFDDILAPGEVLVGPPTIAELVTTDLVIDAGGINSTALTINKEAVPIGRAVVFRVSGHLTENAPYTIQITVSTDSTPAQVLVKELVFGVEA